MFVGAGAAMLAGVFLVRNERFHFAAAWQPLVWAAVVGAWFLVDGLLGHTWIDLSLIRDYYLIGGVFSGVLLWYFVFGASPNPGRLATTLIWALVLVHVAAMALRAWLATGSVISLFDADASFWQLLPSGRFAFGGFNENAIAVEFLAPPLLAGVAALFSPRAGTVAKSLALGACGMFAAMILAAGTRQAVIGCVMGSIVILALSRRAQAVRALAPFVIGVAVAIGAAGALSDLVVQGGGGEVAQLLRPAELVMSDTRIANRLGYARRDLAAALEHPLIGAGLGYGSANNRSGNSPSHNFLTNVAVELGVAPTVLTIAFIFAVARALMHNARAVVDDDSRAGLQAMAGLFVLYLTSAMISGRLEGCYGFLSYGTAILILTNHSRRTSGVVPSATVASFAAPMPARIAVLSQIG
jgi:hypothetical protein